MFKVVDFFADPPWAPGFYIEYQNFYITIESWSGLPERCLNGTCTCDYSTINICSIGGTEHLVLNFTSFNLLEMAFMILFLDTNYSVCPNFFNTTL